MELDYPSSKICCTSTTRLYQTATLAELSGTRSSFNRLRLTCPTTIPSNEGESRAKAHILQTGPAHRPLTKKMMYSSACRNPVTVHASTPFSDIKASQVEEKDLAGRRVSSINDELTPHKTVTSCRKASTSDHVFSASGSASGVKCGANTLSYRSSTTLNSRKAARQRPNLVPYPKGCTPGECKPMFQGYVPSCNPRSRCMVTQ